MSIQRPGWESKGIDCSYFLASITHCWRESSYRPMHRGKLCPVNNSVMLWEESPSCNARQRAYGFTQEVCSEDSQHLQKANIPKPPCWTRVMRCVIALLNEVYSPWDSISEELASEALTKRSLCTSVVHDRRPRLSFSRNLLAVSVAVRSFQYRHSYWLLRGLILCRPREGIHSGRPWFQWLYQAQKSSLPSSLSLVSYYLFFSFFYFFFPLRRFGWHHKWSRLLWNLWWRHERRSNLWAQQPWGKGYIYEICGKYYAQVNIQYHPSSTTREHLYIWNRLLAY